ncbi:hypothetical protein ACWGLP_17220 [Streptomyces lydicus]|uniref:hypothetical protein n=1 Tax=Streptomyces lydicus TaxID=47763 RepID=UPI0037D45248
MAVMTGVLDVMCAMGVVGVALVTGMADVAHAGNRDGLRRRGRPDAPATAAAHPAPAVLRTPAGHLRPARSACPQAPGKGDGV